MISNRTLIQTATQNGETSEAIRLFFHGSKTWKRPTLVSARCARARWLASLRGSERVV